MTFSQKQMLALTWWNRPGLKDYDAIICDGAVRSGKTRSMVGGFFLWSMAVFDGQYPPFAETLSSSFLPGWDGSFTSPSIAGKIS